MPETYNRDEDIAARKAEVYVATRISDLLGDPEVDRVLNGMLHGLQNEWLECMNKDAREHLWIRAQGLQEFLSTLQGLIETGKMAAAQLELMKHDDQSETDSGE